MFRKLLLALVLAAVSTAAAQAQQPSSARAQVDPRTGAPAGYYCSRLGATFLLCDLYLPEFGRFQAMRIVSQPQLGSPLDQLGLELGDVVTRLDGVPLHCYRELDCHAHHTHVRYIKTGTRTVRNASVHIDVQPQGYYSSASRP